MGRTHGRTAAQSPRWLTAEGGVVPLNAHMKLEFENVAGPVARLLGHSAAAALGFCGLGASEIALPLRALELTLLFADIGLFAVVFLSGVAVFAAETVSTATRRIRLALSEDSRDR